MLRIFGCVLLGLGTIAFVTMLVLISHFSATLPRLPSPDEDRIYPLNIHGTSVYLTWCEHVFMNSLYYGSFFISLGGCVLLVWHRRA
jgi:hypothetical protein